MSWTKIQGDELQRLQERFEMPPQTTIREASTLRTPFYHNGELVRMTDGTNTMFMVGFCIILYRDLKEKFTPPMAAFHNGWSFAIRTSS
jgi:hypothetical protein